MRSRPPARQVSQVFAVVALAAAGCSSGGEPAGQASSTTASDATIAALASPACADGGDVTVDRLDVTVDGTPRTAVVHVPAGASTTEPLPVVLSFHGAAEMAEHRSVVDEFTALGDEHGFVSVYPQGLVGHAGPASGVTGWDIEAISVDEPVFVAALLDELGERVCIDEHRIAAAGISNGGGMAMLLACDLADRIRAVASVAGAPVEATCRVEAGPVAMIAFHGLDDTVVPYSGSAPGGPFLPVLDVMAARAETNGCAGEPAVEAVTPTVERRTWTGCAAPVVLYTLDDHGHAWPGHPLPVSQADLASFLDPGIQATGTQTAEELAANLLLTNTSVDASTLIWEFFDATW